MGVVLFLAFALTACGGREALRPQAGESLPPKPAYAETVPTAAELIAPALSIAALGAIESLLSGAVGGRMIGEKMASNQELMAQGIANLVVPFFGGMPSSGALARTAVNVRSGAAGRVTSSWIATTSAPSERADAASATGRSSSTAVPSPKRDRIRIFDRGNQPVEREIVTSGASSAR